MEIRPYTSYLDLPSEFKKIISHIDAYQTVEDRFRFHEEFEALCRCRACNISGAELGEKLHFHHIHKETNKFGVSQCGKCKSAYGIIAESVKTCPFCRSCHMFLEKNEEVTEEWTQQGLLYSMVDRELLAIKDFSWLMRKNPVGSLFEKQRLEMYYPDTRSLMKDLQRQLALLQQSQPKAKQSADLKVKVG